jgi:DNA-binding NarL/FixJ family response regulator
VRSEGLVNVVVGQLGCVIDRGLGQILGGARDLRVVGVGLDHAALERAVARGKAQVVVLDEDSVATPVVPRRLRGARASVGLVVLAHRPTRVRVTRMLADGVNVCLSTDASAPEVVQAVRLAADGRCMFVSVSAHLPRASPERGIRSLTRREREVLELLGAGHKNAEIARVLQISGETARTHTQHVYRKLGVSSRGELLRIEQ